MDNNRTENLLVMILLSSLRGSTMAEKAHTLNMAGFSNIEIANYLSTSGQVIAQLLYENRKKKVVKKSQKN